MLIILNYDNIRINLIVFFIVKRGLISPNCFWWNIANLVINDGSGINLYKELKEKYGKKAPINIMGIDMFLIMDKNYVKEILDNSPNIFCVGELKYNFFRPFMKLNVGVSKGCPWKRRRELNVEVLETNYLHKYANQYNKMINKILSENIPTNFDEFLFSAKQIVSRVVFNKPIIPDKIFEIFSVANSLGGVIYSRALPKQLDKFYRDYIWEELQNPQPYSLLSLTQSTNLDKEELIDQVPHWIFPIGGIIHTVASRTLLLLCNHKDKFNKLINQLQKMNPTSAKNITNVLYLRYCILETLRLNNLVSSTFRTLCEDYTFEDGTYFKKGTQLLILNNPLLRDEECFYLPNKFIPERWNSTLEMSYCTMMFNQGPQKCPGLDLSIFLIQSFIVNYLKYANVLEGSILESQKIDTNNIPQMINPCSITFTIS